MSRVGKRSSATIITAELKRAGTPARAKASAWFFKTGKGQYGEGDVFFGLTVPQQRQIAKRHFEDISLAEIKKLLQAKYHECRFTALEILVMQFERARKNSDQKLQKQIFDFYIANSKQVNNWDLVDTSAPYISGPYLFDKSRTILFKLARSSNLWQKRIAIISCWYFITQKDFTDTLKISEILLNDTHDLIHKAVGWMLREIGNRDLSVERKFLDKHAAIMPRTMLRYAIEKFPEKLRQKYLKMKSGMIK